MKCNILRINCYYDFMKLKDIEVTNPYLKLGKEFYNPQTPAPLNGAFLIHANSSLLEELNIDKSEAKTKEFKDLINGSFFLKGSKPFSMVYAGHQFGHYVPRLGDGRAINIGTIENTHLQLKGSGQTKYSRSGDGRAVLRSSIREYLISEAMHHLGVPTTRALGIVGSNHSVFRESWEKGAIVLRTSPSWVRFGTFEYFAHNNKIDELNALIEYVIEESYPHLKDEKDKTIYMFLEVVGKTAKLMAKWMSIGFNHGVMNTDNMSIAGLTIDYGPFSFFDDFEYDYICNHTDVQGRYSFKNQPLIAKWNLSALLVALSKVADINRLEKALDYFDKIYVDEYQYLMNQKLGLDRVLEDDKKLVSHLLGVLQGLSVDYTLFFRELSNYNGNKDKILNLCLYHTPMREWLEIYDKRLEKNSTPTKERLEKMKQINPKYTLKNYILQEAIDAANQGDFTLVEKLHKIAQTPYDEHPNFHKYSLATPQEFKNQKLSCSS